MSPESFSSVIRRAERRLGRPFQGLSRSYVGATDLRNQGIRVLRDEATSAIEVWCLYFGKGAEPPTIIYGRTIDQAFEYAVNPRPVKPKGRKETT